MPVLLARHNQILHQAIEGHNGYVFQIVGDSFAAAFHSATDALNAAVDAQRLLQAESWSPEPIKVRMGIHTGTSHLNEASAPTVYSGYATLAATQRIMSAGHGGQVLISGATRELVRDVLPAYAELVDLGEKLLKDLMHPEHLYQLNAVELTTAFPPLKTLELLPNNLPVQLTSFVGREKEIEEIKQELAEHRLVTLTGIGGTGKTRLSLQVAADVLDQYLDGVWFIELAPLTDPNLIPRSILAILHYGEQAGKTPLQVLEEQLNNKKLLLILDNCEHLIDACAKVAHALLMAAPEIKILASSREALSVTGELAWQVPSLALPDLKSLPEPKQLTQYESVRLFIERTSLVQPHFKVDENNVHAVAQICYRLDGIPLAIELAVARIKMLSVEQISARLDDRFRLLTGGARTALPRQQTLRALIDWSYDLLSEKERLLLQRLSVFTGGWTLEAAEDVCSGVERDTQRVSPYDILDLLSQLVNKSLVTVVEASQNTQTRYRLLETVRQYAREKLFDSEEGEILHNQHLAYFLDLAEKGDNEITGPNQDEVIELLDAERDNFRTALEWSVSNQCTESAVRLLGALGWAWDVRGYYNEAFGWFAKIRGLPDVPNHPGAYARLLNHIGRYAVTFDKNLDADPILEESQAIWLKLGSQGEHGSAYVLCFLGMNAAINKRDIDKAESFYEKSLELAQKSSNQRVIVASKLFLGNIEYERGNITPALNLYEQSLELSQHIGDLFMIGVASGTLGDLFLEQKSYEKARTLFNQQLQINEKLQFRLGIAAALLGLGDLYRHKGDYIQAEQHLEKSLSMSRDLGLQDNVSFILYLLSLLALHQNDYSSAAGRFREYLDFAQAREAEISLCRFFIGISAVTGGINQSERCAKLFGATQATFETLDYRISQFDRSEFDRHIQIAREQLGSATFDALSDEGRTMTMEQAIAYALEGVNE